MPIASVGYKKRIPADEAVLVDPFPSSKVCRKQLPSTGSLPPAVTSSLSSDGPTIVSNISEAALALLLAMNFHPASNLQTRDMPRIMGGEQKEELLQLLDLGRKKKGDPINLEAQGAR